MARVCSPVARTEVLPNVAFGPIASLGISAVRMEWIVAAVVLAVLLYAIFVFNRLVRLRNLVREGWSGIDVQLRRRTDLVPNLVDDREGLCRARTRRVRGSDAKRALRASRPAASTGRRRRSGRCRARSAGLMAVAEAYPQLKADKNFLDLQTQLAEIEDQLQMARRYYNGAARNLNIAHPVVSRSPGRAHAGFQRGAVLRARRPRRGRGAANRIPGRQAMNRDPTPRARIRVPRWAHSRRAMRPSASCCSSATWWWSATAISLSPRPSASRPRAGDPPRHPARFSHPLYAS